MPTRRRRIELLAPAGQPDAAYAALHYGADAVYLGLGRFSARVEAENFTPEQLNAVVAHAHALVPARKVYLALNTLIQERELPGAVDCLLAAAEAGVDAVIMQDLGLVKIARERFPDLVLHASTQLAVHNPEGVRTARDLGFSRVTLARELTLRELRDIAGQAEIETEVFIHGTLCHSYSGLCLFSSIMSGRSGNRGRCDYSCRGAAATAAGPVHPFSLKDLALGADVLALAKIGITSLKIEGRKKSSLYVAATVDHYRRLLDGELSPDAAKAGEARLKTIFARPWTKFFLAGRRNPEAADPDVVGHRGAPSGVLEGIAATPVGPGIIFTPVLPLERHDGIQIDLPGHSRPYGFPVNKLYTPGAGVPEPVFAVPAGRRTIAALPADAPGLEPGLPLYLASSQAVKRAYPFPRPAPGALDAPLAIQVAVSLSAGAAEQSCRITAEARLTPPPFLARQAGAPITATVDAEAPAFPARDVAGAEEAARKAFSRTGGSRFALDSFAFANTDRLYVKPGNFNQLRRELLRRLEEEYQAAREIIRARNASALAGAGARRDSGRCAWSIAVDEAALLENFSPADFAEVDETIVSVQPWRMPDLTKLARCVPIEKIRFALPVIVREEDRVQLRDSVQALADAGHRRWLLPNLGSLGFIERGGDSDLSADWPLYALNSFAAKQLLELGFSSFSLSPEDDAENWRALLTAYPGQVWATVYADLPLFISAVCVHDQLGQCLDAANPAECRRKSEPMVFHLGKAGSVQVRAIGCGSVTTGARAFSLARHLDQLKSMGAEKLRVDLRWRDHASDSAVELWRGIRRGLSGPASEGNFLRGLR